MTELLKQEGKPLFAEVLWNKPVTKKHAKRLLIVGGNSHSFKNVQEIYTAAERAGIGEAKIVLPDALRSAIGDFADAIFVPSTSSGSIGGEAYEDIFNAAQVSDGLLLGSELSANSETISLVEELLQQLDLPLIFSDDAIKTLLFRPQLITSKPHHLLVATTKTLASLAAKLEMELKIEADAGLMNKVKLLLDLSDKSGAAVVNTEPGCIVAAEGKASFTLVGKRTPAEITAYMSVFWLQHPKAFGALTSAAFELSNQ